jgi:hypothetical protein
MPTELGVISLVLAFRAGLRSPRSSTQQRLSQKDQTRFVGHVHLPVFVRPQLARVSMKKQPNAPGRFDAGVIRV